MLLMPKGQTIQIPLQPFQACLILFNHQWKLLTVPSELEYTPSPKIAKLVPIFKKESRDEVSNYRPISVLPFFSKLFEKVRYERLNNYITKFNILFTSQHGFQSGHSTFMPLLNMQDKISDAMDKNQYSKGIFPHLAKVFNTRDHDSLLKLFLNFLFVGFVLPN